jgi:hypothetical protein
MKQGIQGSSDAAAFSAAVIMAKGMNLISFLNLMLTVVIGLVVLAQLLPWAALGTALTLTGLVACDFDPWCPCCCGCWAESHVVEGWAHYVRIAGRTSGKQNTLRQWGRAITTAQTVVQYAAEAGAIIAGAQVGMDRVYGPGLLSAPIVLPPPLRRVDSDTLCRGSDAFPAFERNLRRDVPQIGGTAWQAAALGVASYSSDTVVSAMTMANLEGLMGMERALGSFLCHDAMGNNNMRPLELEQNWRGGTKIRAVTLRTEDNHDQRLRAVSVAAGNQYGSFNLPGMVAFAQSQYINASEPNPNEDAVRMYQMDWHATLQRFRFTDGGPNPSGNPLLTGILTSISPLLGSVVGADNFWLGLQDGLILH